MALLNKNQGLEGLGLVAEPKMPPTPFIFNENIDSIWNGKRYAYNINQLLADVKRGRITKRDLNIVEALYRHHYLTAHHLKRLFFKDISDSKVISKKLQTLESMRLITRMGWTLNGKETRTKTYMLDDGGAKLLQIYRQLEMKQWRSENNIRSISYIFRLLMANEIFTKLIELTHRMPEGGVGNFVIEPALRISEGPHHMVIPTASFSFNKGNKVYDFMLEVVRGNDFELLPSKLKKYNEWYLKEEKKQPPVLFICVEKDSQALSLNKVMREFELEEIQKWCRFTSDSRIVGEELANAFFNTKNDLIVSIQNRVLNED